MKKLGKRFLAVGLLCSATLGAGLISDHVVQADANNTVAIIHDGNKPLYKGYGQNAKTIKNLPDGSRWKAYRALVDVNGTEYFDLGANQWVTANDAWLNDYYSIPVINLGTFHEDARNVAMITSEKPAVLWNGNGAEKSATNRTLDIGSAWVATAKKTVSGETWYQVGRGQWISGNDVTMNHGWKVITEDANTGTNGGATNGGNTNTNSTQNNGNTGNTTNNNNGSQGNENNNQNEQNKPNNSGNSGDVTWTTSGNYNLTTNQNVSDTLESVLGNSSSNTQWIPVPEESSIISKKSSDQGVVSVQAYSSQGYPLRDSYAAYGKVGDSYKISLPTTFTDQAGNIYRAKNDQNVVAGIFENTGAVDVEVIYEQQHPQNINVDDLKSEGYRLMDEYRSSHGLPAMQYDVNLERNAQMAVNNLLEGYQTDMAVTRFSIVRGDNNELVGMKDLPERFNNNWMNYGILSAVADNASLTKLGLAVAFDSDTNSYYFVWNASY